MRKEDLIGIGGGLLCLGLAWLDEPWRLFWLIAGGFLIVWSVLTAILGRREK